MATRNQYYEQPMSNKAKRQAASELDFLGDALAEVMHLHGGQSAMVRTWIDPQGRTMLAANLYNKSPNAPSDGNPSVEFRKEVGQ